MLHTHLASIAIAAITLAAAGCGGSSKTGSTKTEAATTAHTPTTPATTPVATGEPITMSSGKPLARATWIAKGDAICARTNAALNSTILKNRQDYIRVLPQAAGYDHTEAVELSKLVPPKGLAGDWKQIVIGFQRFGEYTATVAGYVRVNNLKATPPLTQAAKVVHERLAAIAKRDGFKQCSVL